MTSTVAPAPAAAQAPAPGVAQASVALDMPWFESPCFPKLLERSGLGAREKELVRHFAERGYVVIDPGLDADALAEEVKRDLAPRWQGSGRIQDAWKLSDAVKRAALAPSVLETLELLYGREPVPFQTLNFSRGTEQATHSDTIHFHSVPERFMCAVWVALEDIDAGNGPLHYYPGSHKLPILDYRDLGIGEALPPEAPALRAKFLGVPQPLRRRPSLLAPFRMLSRTVRRKLAKALGKTVGTGYGSAGSEELYKRYEDAVRALLLETGIAREEVSLKKGQAFVWSANLFHGGSPIRDKSRSRHTQVTHYYFSGCMYYTPLMSAPHMGKYYMRKVRRIGTGEVVPQLYRGVEIDTTDFNE